MSVDSRDIIEVFRSIVDEVRAAIDPTSGTPFYDYGHPYDISAKISEKGSSISYKSKQFPIICLLLDVSEEKGYDISIEYKVSPTVLILANTSKDYHTEGRVENVFDPVLNPIYYALIGAMSKSRYIKQRPEGIDHTATKRYYWGKTGIRLSSNDDPVFNQNLDGIEINFRNIEIYKRSTKNC